MGISRTEVMRRARTMWPAGSVPYSQNTIHSPDGYRQDCSGFVSLCWAVPTSGPGLWGGFSTVTALSGGWMREIQPDDLRPGDAVGLCGPGTGGDDGHIQLFVAWDNQVPSDNGHTVMEQTPRFGPHTSHYATWTAGYRAYRFRDITEDAPAPPPPTPKPAVPPWPLPPGHYYGLITGPNESHGGYYASERPNVLRIQQRLQALGYAPKTPGWADSIFEQPTKDAVAAWQRAKYANLTSRYGEVWSDDWKRLFS